MGRKAAILRNQKGKQPNSGRFDRSLVDQHDGEAIAHWIHTVALCALDPLRVIFPHQWLDADRTGHQFEQVLRNHSGYIVRRRLPGKAQFNTVGEWDVHLDRKGENYLTAETANVERPDRSLIPGQVSVESHGNARSLDPPLIA